MSEGHTNQTVCFPRGRFENLREAILVKNAIGEVPDGHVLLKVEKFGWSANNVTYGMLGEDPHFRYFDFLPVPQTTETSAQTHGIIPVWGFADVVLSRVPGISVGERVFGYFSPSKYLVLPIESNGINRFNFYVTRSHLPSDRRPYNQITRCGADPLYVRSEEDASMLYRPLFWTSFWCEDWLNSIDYKGADTIIVSSASSKTGFCLALAIKKRLERSGNKSMTVIGLTSPSNIEFVRGLKLYDTILLYEDLTSIGPSLGLVCYVDVAGNSSLNEKVLAHFGKNLLLGVALGMSHPTSKSIKTAAEASNKFEMFFMPEWLHAVRQVTKVEEIAKRQAEGWRWIMEGGKDWVKLEKHYGPEAALIKIRQSMKDPLEPNIGLICSLWDDSFNLSKL